MVLSFLAHEAWGRPDRPQPRATGGANGDAAFESLAEPAAPSFEGFQIGGRCGCWWPRTLRRAASTWTGSRTLSTMIFRCTRRIMCIGLAARDGPRRWGDAISFVTPEDHGDLRALERFIGRGIVRKRAEGFIIMSRDPSQGEGARAGQSQRGGQRPGASAWPAAGKAAGQTTAANGVLILTAGVEARSLRL